jgi:hypothetical protein
MAPKQNRQPDAPDPKGKGRADPPSHHDTGDQADQHNWAAALREPKPKKKSKSRKRREDDEEEYPSSDESIFRDMGGPHPQRDLIEHFNALPPAVTTIAPASSNPGAGLRPPPTGASPLPSPVLQLHDDISSSTSSFPHSHTRDDNSSNASSRGSKRRQDPSPQPPRRPSRSNLCPHSRSPPQPSPPDRQVAMLQLQVRNAQAEVLALRKQLSREFDVGFAHGRAMGFDEAMQLAESTGPHHYEGRGREPRDPDEEEAAELRRAVRQSRQDARLPRPEATSGAGPSRSQDRPGPHQASSSRPRNPTAPVPVPDPAPSHRDYEIRVIRKGGHEYPDPKTTKWEGFSCIPLPTGFSMPQRGIAVVRGPNTPPNPEDATSYLELWAGFATGRTVPDPFRRLFQAIGSAYHPADARDAVLGYALVRRITTLHSGTFGRDAINAFLITLAAFDRTLGLTAGRDSLWNALLARDSTRPLSRWEELRAFAHPEIYPRDDFGLTFLPPSDTSQPWEIRTLWRRDDFMQVLLAVRPTLQELRRLLAYADVFIRT